MDETYTKYLNEPQFHTEGKVSHATFARYVQQEFLPMSKIPEMEARCETDDNVQFCIDALANVKVQGISGSRYHIIKQTLCEPKIEMSNTQHKFCDIACYQWKCDSCGVSLWKENIESQNEEILNDKKLMRWLQWENTGHDATGKLTSVLQKEWKIGSTHDCFDSLCEQLETFALHQFNAEWHQLQFSTLQSSVPENIILQVMDFSKNYTIRSTDEVQFAYWDAPSVTIHGIVCYYKCPEKCGHVVTHEVIHLSNDGTHDSFMPQLAVDQVLQELTKIRVSMKYIVQMSDNCSSQYKSYRPFAEISRSQLLTMRVFFGECHGKLPCDALFSHIKKQLNTFIFKRNSRLNQNPFVIHSAHDVFQYCKTHLEKQSSCAEKGHKALTFKYITASQLC